MKLLNDLRRARTRCTEYEMYRYDVSIGDTDAHKAKTYCGYCQFASCSCSGKPSFKSNAAASAEPVGSPGSGAGTRNATPGSAASSGWPAAAALPPGVAPQFQTTHSAVVAGGAAAADSYQFQISGSRVDSVPQGGELGFGDPRVRVASKDRLGTDSACTALLLPRRARPL